MRRVCWFLILIALCGRHPVRAAGQGFAATGFTATGFALPSMRCRQAIAQAEQAQRIPPGLLAAIGRVESGRRDPVSGALVPWPWTIDVEGQGSFHDSKIEAIAAVRRSQAAGARSIDVGCMQVNLLQHPAAFTSLEAAFDPDSNARYAARFLRQLYAEAGDWGRAAAMYHSATPAIGADYQRKVMAAWPEETRLAAAPGASPLARAWAATLGDHQTAIPGSPFGASHRLFSIAARSAPVRPVMQASAPGMARPPGRSLAAYRAMPIMLATRIPFARLR